MEEEGEDPESPNLCKYNNSDDSHLMMMHQDLDILKTSKDSLCEQLRLKMEAEDELQTIFGRRENHCAERIVVPPTCKAPEPRPEYIRTQITPELMEPKKESEIK